MRAPRSPKSGAFVPNLISINLAAVLQNVDRRGDDVRHMQPTPAGAYPLATLGLELRPHVGLQHSADGVDLPRLLHEFLPESAALRLSVAQLSQGYARAAALQGLQGP